MPFRTESGVERGQQGPLRGRQPQANLSDESDIAGIARPIDASYSSANRVSRTSGGVPFER